jgi:hypothetical protein
MDNRHTGEGVVPGPTTWVHWPVYWSAVWVGALASLAAVIVFGLAGVALGFHLMGPEGRIVDWHKFGVGTLAFSVIGAFIAFVIGGWIAARTAGLTRAEPAMLHGAIAWLVAVPILILSATLGGANTMGGWYGGLAGSPSWTAAPVPSVTTAVVSADAEPAAKAAREEAAKVTRNTALGAITALLLGLVGSVIGGWMASGEPMTFGHYMRPRQGTARV